MKKSIQKILEKIYGPYYIGGLYLTILISVILIIFIFLVEIGFIILLK